MVNFDKQAIINNYDYIYNQKAKIELIGDELCKKDFDLLFFTSSGGSMAMLQPFEHYINVYSKLHTASMVSADYLLQGYNQLTNKSIAFMTSKSGDTKETIECAKKLKQQGITIVSVCGKDDTPLQKLSDYCFVYLDGRPQELVFYILIGRILFNKGYFASYYDFVDNLKYLGNALAEVRIACDEKCRKYAMAYHNEPYNIWVGSGELWPVTYAYAMCVLEESQWVKTKSVTSAEFFHGTLELVQNDTCVTLVTGEGITSKLDDRVKEFVQPITDKFTCFDTKDYELPGIKQEYRKLLSPVVMNAILQRIGKNMEDITKHSLDIRRYYRKVNY